MVAIWLPNVVFGTVYFNCSVLWVVVMWLTRVLLTRFFTNGDH